MALRGEQVGPVALRCVASRWVRLRGVAWRAGGVGCVALRGEQVGSVALRCVASRWGRLHGEQVWPAWFASDAWMGTK